MGHRCCCPPIMVCLTFPLVFSYLLVPLFDTCSSSHEESHPLVSGDLVSCSPNSVVVFIFILIGVVFVAIGMAFAWLLRPNRPYPSKRTTYECGESPVGRHPHEVQHPFLRYRPDLHCVRRGGGLPLSVGARVSIPRMVCLLRDDCVPHHSPCGVRVRMAERGSGVGQTRSTHPAV